MSELNNPPIPADTDVRDLDGFMLNVERLMASELVALSSHEVVAASLFLWCRAWKQLPAASLPDDERVIAAFARLPLPRFRKLRPEVMRGFVLCSDGRWYHKVLAVEAARAHGRKKRFNAKRETDAERLRKWRESHRETPPETHGETRNEMHVETRFVQEGTGSGQGLVNRSEPPAIPEPQKAREDGATPTPAGAICRALRARGIEAQPADPRVMLIAEQGIDLATVDAAALEARQAKGQDRIPVGYVLSILERWSQEAQQRRVAGAQAPPKGGTLGRIAETVAAFTGFGAAGGNEDDGRVFDGHAQRIAG